MRMLPDVIGDVVGVLPTSAQLTDSLRRTSRASRRGFRRSSTLVPPVSGEFATVPLQVSNVALQPSSLGDDASRFARGLPAGDHLAPFIKETRPYGRCEGRPASICDSSHTPLRGLAESVLLVASVASRWIWKTKV